MYQAPFAEWLAPHEARGRLTRQTSPRTIQGPIEPVWRFFSLAKVNFRKLQEPARATSIAIENSKGGVPKRKQKGRSDEKQMCSSSNVVFAGGGRSLRPVDADLAHHELGLRSSVLPERLPPVPGGWSETPAAGPALSCDPEFTQLEELSTGF